MGSFMVYWDGQKVDFVSGATEEYSVRCIEEAPETPDGTGAPKLRQLCGILIHPV